ncbi:MAG: FAD-binding oxidoreductase [Rhodobacterales bacterium]|nr:FAD-binding oxidoreductase [Rhodobacterales bacterium]
MTDLPRDDTGCGWINILPPRGAVNRLRGDVTADAIVLGAGFTGLAAARRLAELAPDKRVVVVDAQRAGEGSSGRNSGFVVDLSPLPKKTIGPADIESYRRMHRINTHGIALLRDAIGAHGIDCDWSETGKYHGAAEERHYDVLRTYAAHMAQLGIDHAELDAAALKARLGTAHYTYGVHARGAVMAQPAALARGLALSLPGNVTLLEDSPVEAIDYGPTVRVRGRDGTVTAPMILLAANAFTPDLGQMRHRMMSLTLTGSLTRPLTEAERDALGRPEPWGVLSAHRFGATVRYTADHRIMVRNTAEYWPRKAMDAADLDRRKALHVRGFNTRFPMLPEVTFEHTWSGLVCVSRNLTTAFGRVAPNVFLAACYNAGGVSKGTALGDALAHLALGSDMPLLADALALAPPAWLPPRPFLDLGARLDLARRRRDVGAEL